MKSCSIPRQVRACSELVESDGEQTCLERSRKSRTILVSLIIALLAGTVAEAKYGGGSGTEQDPYLIYTSEQMNTIGANQDDWGKHFRLMADIDLSAYTGTQFNIIGRFIKWGDPGTKSFTGVFDGNDHKIFNFTWTSYDVNHVGLFGFVESSQIKNLGLENVNVQAVNGDFVGGLVGFDNPGDSVITNCYSMGRILGAWYVGGLVGSGGTVTNCYSTARVVGTYYVGGLVGSNGSATMTNCYSTGRALGRQFVGGLVGQAWGSTITDCYSTGNISADLHCVGGIVGINRYGMVTECYSAGNVSGDRDIGGLVGVNYSATITDSYSTGNVTGYWFVGGLVGENESEESISTIIDCYSVGSVSGTLEVGGLVGLNSGGQIWDSFWDKQTSGQLTSAGGIPKTTAEMKTKSTFTDAGWDFVNVWHICEATNYPRLRWQILAGDFLCPYGVDFTDFAVLASAWQSKPTSTNWKPACDISQPKDNFIDELDLAIFCENWLEER